MQLLPEGIVEASSLDSLKMKLDAHRREKRMGDNSAGIT